MLCALCLSIFTQRLLEFEWPDTFWHIRKADDAGCKICSGLMMDILLYPRAGRMDRLLDRPERNEFSCSFYPLAPDCFRMNIGNTLCAMDEFFLVRNESVQMPEGYPAYLHHASLDLMREPWRVRPDGFQKSIPRSTGDPRVTEIALGWLDSCLNSHGACSPDLADQHPVTYPKRLIKVGRSTSRLIVTEDESPDGCYATLSHCWGKDPAFFTLTQSRLQSLKHQLPLNALPQTFRDSITLVRRLKIPYLWIDSLCIVQDSNQDWLEHAETTASIYEGCVMNISVDHASSPFAGIFRDRNADPVQECHVLWSPSGEEETVWTVINQTDDVFFRHRLPLETRAWVFQERLLAPRVLHFGMNTLFWECKTIPCACEASPTISQFWHSKLTLFSIGLDPPRQLTRKRMAEYHSRIRTQFHSLVTKYSGLELTRPDEDKLVAFSGIAKRIGGIAYYDQEYFAGFFLKDLPTDLVWLKAGSEITNRSQGTYRAPTWSWASLDGHIATFPWDNQINYFDTVVLTEVQWISVSNVDPGNRYGQIKTAKLALLCKLIPCRIGAIAMLDRPLYAHLQDGAEPSNIIGKFRPDMREGASYEGLKFACPIVECRWREGQVGREIRGIVLQTTEDGMCYERLGFFASGFRKSGKVEELHHMVGLAKTQVITIV